MTSSFSSIFYRWTIVLISVILCFNHIEFVDAQLPQEQVQLLKLLGAYTYVTWIPYGQDPGCGSFGYQRTLVLCNPEKTQITGISIETNVGITYFYGEALDFSVVPYLDSLTFYTITPITVIPSLMTHKNITTFQIIYDNPYSPIDIVNQGMIVDYTRTDWTGMTKLSKVRIDGLAGYCPIFPTSVTSLRFKPPSEASYRQITICQIQANLFTPNLTVYEVNTYNTLMSSPQVFNIDLSLAPNLQSFAIQSRNYKVEFQNFYNIPKLTSLRLINVLASDSNKTMPLPNEVKWDNLQELELQGLGLTGAFSSQYFKMIYLTKLNLNFNPGLTLTIPNDLNATQISTFSCNGCTGLTGSIPNNILDNLYMETLDLSYSSIGGAIPRVFLCIPSVLLTTNFLFTGLVFTNYNGSITQRDCHPVVYPIAPISINKTIIIDGEDLGYKSIYQYMAISNSIGDIASINCGITIPNKRMECANPQLLGSGTLTYYIMNNQQYLGITANFTYQKPSVYKITPCPTLGGRITLYGYDLMCSPLRKKETGISIYGKPCINSQVLTPCQTITCDYSAGITSNVPISVQVSGIFNNATNDAYFFYQPPNVVSSYATMPNVATQLTITGSDFWNDNSMISVVIEDDPPIPCPVTFTNHSYFVCDFPASPYTVGRKNIKVTVNGQTSAPNKLFEFLDERVCPNYCSNNGICDVAIGFCVCNSISNNNTLFGPSCEQVSVGNTMELSTSEPILKLIPSFNDKTVLSAKLISVIENGAEIIIPTWIYTFDNVSGIHNYRWTSGAKIVTVSIIPNQKGGSASFGGSYLTFPKDSYTYAVNYTLDGGFDDSVQFKFSIDVTPDECTNAPITLASPVGTNSSTGVTGDLRWSLLTVYDVEWFTRHPGIAHVNDDGFSGIAETSLIQQQGSSQSLLVDVKPSQTGDGKIRNLYFQYDFAVLQATSSRSPKTSGCEDTSIAKWKIAVAVIGAVIGAALIGVGTFFIVKQQLKMNQTKALLDKRLKELNVSL